MRPFPGAARYQGTISSPRCHRVHTEAFDEGDVMSPRIGFAIVVIGLGLLLTGYGRSPGERALTAGLMGAGAGAVVGCATGGNSLTRALIGGGVGAVGGAVTAPHRH